MAETRKLPRAKKDDVLTAQMWNDLIDRVNRTRVLFGEGNGFDVMETPDGVMVRSTSGRDAPILGLTSSSITARSGATAGGGTVTPYTAGGTLGATGDADIDVINFSATAISSGKYCVVTVIDGVNVVTSVEC